MHAGMHYMQNHFEKRINPSLLVENAKSVIVVTQNYFQIPSQKDSTAPVISKYAYGKDYHVVVKNKLYQLLEIIRKFEPKVNARVFCDSAPVLERALAANAGIGWIGKSNNLITNGGCHFFIGEIITDFELQTDSPINNRCGDCTKCLDACPSGALEKPYLLNANKCLSYLTIEHKGELPLNKKDRFQNRIFGCDACTDACPYGKIAQPHQEPNLMPISYLMNLTKEEWFNLSEVEYNEHFKGTAFERAGYSNLRRNLDFLYSKIV